MPKKSKLLKVGYAYQVVANNSNHYFKIGSIVECCEAKDYGSYVSNRCSTALPFTRNFQWWYTLPEDLKRLGKI